MFDDPVALLITSLARWENVRPVPEFQEPCPDLISLQLCCTQFLLLSFLLILDQIDMLLFYAHIKVILFTFTFQKGLTWPNKIIGQPVDADFSSSQDESVELRCTWRPPPPSPGWRSHFHSPSSFLFSFFFIFKLSYQQALLTKRCHYLFENIWNDFLN